AITAKADDFTDLPEPVLPALSTPWSIVVAGVGGTGVITIGALVGMAAHIEGKGITVLDMTGLAQKGGAVMSYVRIADRQGALHAARVSTGEANLVIGCDLIVAVGDDALSKMRNGVTRTVVNTGQAITGDFVRNPDFPFPLAAMKGQLIDAVGAGAEFVDASRLAALLMGHSIATNVFLLGYAWQKGLVPVSLEALARAIELNGVAIDENLEAFRWGRRAACDPAGVERPVAAPHPPLPARRLSRGAAELTARRGGDRLVTAAEPAVPAHRLSRDVEELTARRRDYLVSYQDAAYAQRYVDLVERARRAERAVDSDSTAFTEAVARGWFRLLARKDA